MAINYLELGVVLLGILSVLWVYMYVFATPKILICVFQKIENGRKFNELRRISIKHSLLEEKKDFIKTKIELIKSRKSLETEIEKSSKDLRDQELKNLKTL